MGKAVLVNGNDNVVTAVSNFKDGESATYMVGSERRQIKVREAIRYGHKISIAKIAKGGNITKYGEPIGRAKADIEPGQWVHIHNTEESYEPAR